MCLSVRVVYNDSNHKTPGDDDGMLICIYTSTSICTGHPDGGDAGIPGNDLRHHGLAALAVRGSGSVGWCIAGIDVGSVESIPIPTFPPSESPFYFHHPLPRQWTGWSLLVVLALYDLCAVLTPCGPLRYLVRRCFGI